MTKMIYGDVDLPFIGVCGGSASGKTTVAKKIIEALDVQWVSLLSMDSFYRVVVYYSISVGQWNACFLSSFLFLIKTTTSLEWSC